MWSTIEGVYHTKEQELKPKPISVPVSVLKLELEHFVRYLQLSEKIMLLSLLCCICIVHFQLVVKHKVQENKKILNISDSMIVPILGSKKEIVKKQCNVVKIVFDL